ncbi:LuxR family transcriptional regulator [Streptomyces sp. WI04-05B]|uniref:LuxR family transcriptional regulator AbsR2 n=1 Tax=Streptomyces TaxID=1883 RepID=UPI0029BD2138|nr:MULTISPECIES: LuxR family transcriptional regulator [unclassified Streptomyces]MDX2543524.1 LuxR family transcriptional regulator [Streptomyces sp. WI04-05B]MDX2582988.1 LuxR family transcriptional regulator [Streptomyces sp. WI04-05A]
MTTSLRDARTLELPWPFTGRDDELELVRRSLAAERRGVVVTGPPGRGKTRLVTEAVRGTDCAKVSGTPETRDVPFAAFAHLLPERVTLHRAVQLLTGVRTLLVDDAHLLDGSSAALVHQLAVHGRTRLLVVATDGSTAPGAVSRLWTGEVLPRLALEPLPREETAQLVAAGVGAPVEPLTARRLHDLCQGDLRLLRDLIGAVLERGELALDSDELKWRGPVPVTAPVRERAAEALNRACAAERDALDRLAFSEPLALDLADLDLYALERLEADGLIRVDAMTEVRLAHPLHGPVLRACAGRLRARRLSRTPAECVTALEAERAELADRIERTDVQEPAGPVGDWLTAENTGPHPAVPVGYATVRARFARLRGELREALSWAREGLRADPDDPSCRTELALASTQSSEAATASPGPATPWLRAALGDLAGALESVTDPDGGAGEAYALYDAVRLGAPHLVADRLARLPGAGAEPLARHADALVRQDGPALDRAAELLERRGLLLFAAEAHAQAVPVHRDPSAARRSRSRAMTLARRCQGARTPALSGLVLGELTARQRQIVTLAATGLSNRQIADRLTLSIRTVGNHLYSAYSRLGASDRAALPWLLEDTQTAQPA